MVVALACATFVVLSLSPVRLVPVDARPAALATAPASHGVGRRYAVQPARSARELHKILGPDPAIQTDSGDTVVSRSGADFEVAFAWGGGDVSLGLRDLTVHGRYAGAAAACRQAPTAEDGCHEVENADWLTSSPGEVDLFTTDGWEVVAGATAAGGSADPVLSADELRAIAQDGRWFE